jgi:hypothetical protein
MNMLASEKEEGYRMVMDVQLWDLLRRPLEVMSFQQVGKAAPWRATSMPVSDLELQRPRAMNMLASKKEEGYRMVMDVQLWDLLRRTLEVMSFQQLGQVDPWQARSMPASDLEPQRPLAMSMLASEKEEDYRMDMLKRSLDLLHISVKEWLLRRTWFQMDRLLA